LLLEAAAPTLGEVERWRNGPRGGREGDLPADLWGSQLRVAAVDAAGEPEKRRRVLPLDLLLLL